MIVETHVNKLDELIQIFFKEPINHINKISSIDSYEWKIINSSIDDLDNKIEQIYLEDKKIGYYYESEDFKKIKETCELISQSQHDFNEYINEKAQRISQLFGKRIARTETTNNDVYNYVRKYQKNITPFNAEVSATVFSSAENDPIGYVIKNFYPNKSQYYTQIEKLRVLIQELETLKESKDILENYKKEYEAYVKDVPEYILEKDETGFYSRLGLAIVDENSLNIGYSFSYTSNGGLVQRCFNVPMDEENIIEIIERLQNKLSLEELSREQRRLMTTKLRMSIKERDNFTCCQCGNSIYKEPNLLLEVDHKIPISKGGLTQEDNLQTLCWKCNRNKGAKLI